MSAEAQLCRIMVVGAVRIVGLATSKALKGDREDACSISAVGDNGERSVFRRLQRCCASSNVYEEICA